MVSSLRVVPEASEPNGARNESDGDQLLLAISRSPNDSLRPPRLPRPRGADTASSHASSRLDPSVEDAGVRGKVKNVPSEEERDFLWRVVRSKWFTVPVLVAMFMVSFNRFFMWIWVYGPGNRLHTVHERRLFYMAPIVQMAGVVIYHQRAPRYLSAPLQRVFLRKLFWNELLIMGMGIPLGIATFALEYVNEGISPKTLGPNDTEVMTTNFSLRMMSLAGLTCLPGLLQGIVAVRRPTLVPKMGDDILSPVWVHRSLLISLMTAIAGLSLVFAVVALFAQRYAELDMGNDYTPRIPAVVEANLYIAELMRMQPRTPQDVAAAAAVIDESGTPLRLAMADFAVGDGAFAQWTAPDFEKGLVARVIEVAWEDPPGTYLFDYDRVFHSMVLWEPITATIFLLTSFLFLWLSSQTVQAIVVAPLQKMLAALTTTASVIGPDGRISSESPSAAPMDIGEAVRRFLMLATYATKHRSVINKLSEKGDSDGDKGAEAPGGALKGTRGSSASRLLPLDVTPSLAGSIRGTSSRDMSVTAEGADARMKFGTVVLNGVGVRGWSPAVLLGDELVQAVHLIWIKMRVPDKVCSRKAFVAWAHELFKRHPTMRFHCTWRAVGSLHAAFMLLKQREFAHLTSLHRMAVIVAALSCCAGNVGTADDQLCERNHELAVLYGHLHPQRLASVAVCFGVAAASKDADIFADLTPKEAARMRSWIRALILATTDDSIRQLTSQLRLLAGQLQVEEAQAMLESQQPSGRKKRTSIAPELAMQTLTALGSIGHYALGPDQWARSERMYIEEQLDFLDRSGETDLPRQATQRELTDKRMGLWKDVHVPFLSALGEIVPPVADDAAKVSAAVETFSILPNSTLPRLHLGTLDPTQWPLSSAI